MHGSAMFARISTAYEGVHSPLQQPSSQLKLHNGKKHWSATGYQEVFH